jgi:leucyl aminopeptidase
MPLRFSTSKTLPDAVDAVVVGVFSDESGSDGSRDESSAELVDRNFLARQGFAAKAGEVVALPGAGERTVFAVGMGPSQEVGLATYRRAGAALATACSRYRRVATTVLAERPDGIDGAEAARAFAEGAVLGGYRFTAYKTPASSNPTVSLDRVVVVDEGGRSTTTALTLGQTVADAVCTARDLVNEPGGTLTPSVFAERAVNLGREHGFAVRVRDERGIQRARMGGLLGVNRGSTEPPRFLELSWSPPGASSAKAPASKTRTSKSRTRSVALVGKGVTFDSGGLSLKTSEGMRGMKGDMTRRAA